MVVCCGEWWCVVMCGSVWWCAVVCGGLWRCAVVCCGLWWSVVVCGGLWWSGGGLWWSVVAGGGLWWSSVVRGGLLRSVIVHRWSAVVCGVLMFAASSRHGVDMESKLRSSKFAPHAWLLLPPGLGEFGVQSDKSTLLPIVEAMIKAHSHLAPAAAPAIAGNYKSIGILPALR